MRPLLPALVALALALAPALAQPHTHQGGENGELVVVLRDGPASGRALVGGLTHLGFALVDGHGIPVRHENAVVTLTQNGVVLVHSEATHEYDGLFTLDVTFAVPGPYEMLVESGTGATASWTGVAVEAVDPVRPEIALEVPASVPAFTPARIVVRVEEAGAIVEHTDALVEVRRVGDRLLVHRGHLHTHDEEMVADLEMAQPGDYEVRALGYLAFPTGRDGERDVLPAVATATFTVTPPTAPAVRLPALRAPAGAAADGAAADGADAHAGDGYVLSLTLDPENRSGPFNHNRFSALVWDPAAKEAVQHVNFEASVRGNGHTPFFSKSLHEYDGHLEVLLAGLPPGLYTWSVKAAQRDWSAEESVTLLVLPPVVPAGSGPAEVVVTGTEDLEAGVPAVLGFSLRYPGGVVIPHSEVDFAVFAEGAASPLVLAKVHTHMVEPTATLAFPVAGEYTIVADGDTLVPTLTFGAGAEGLAFGSLLRITVAEGPGLPLAAPEGVAASEEVRPLPGPAVAWLLAGLLAVAGLRRHR